MKKYLPLIVALIFGAGGFWGGMQYAQSKIPSSNPPRGNFAAGQGRGMNFGNASSTARFGTRGGNMVGGEVLAKDDKSITVKITDGGSKIVFYSTSTQFMKSDKGSISDVEIGKPVFINGSANSDGTLTAQNVQLGGGIRFDTLMPKAVQ